MSVAPIVAGRETGAGLDRAAKLSDQQKADLKAVLTEEAAELGKLQKEHRGDMSFTIPGTIEIVTDTNAAILALATPAQKAAAMADHCELPRA